MLITLWPCLKQRAFVSYQVNRPYIFSHAKNFFLGSGFGQKEGVWHFRSTFLPEEHLFDEFCNALLQFHQDFIIQHS